MNEAVVTGALVKVIPEVMPGAVVFKFFDLVTMGIPDLAVTWNRRTAWLELKFDEGEVRPDQIITMRMLAAVGIAYYIRFAQHGTGVTITDPRHDSPAAIYEKLDVRFAARWVRNRLERG